MDKITFTNGQQPALNDTNLNLLQDNIEKAINALKPTILFQGTVQENFTLSDDISNYKKITIYYYDNNGSRYSVTVDNSAKANDITVALSGIYNGGEYFNTKVRMYRIVGKNVSAGGYAEFNFTNSAIEYYKQITITLVEGYK